MRIATAALVPFLACCLTPKTVPLEDADAGNEHDGGAMVTRMDASALDAAPYNLDANGFADAVWEGGPIHDAAVLDAVTPIDASSSIDASIVESPSTCGTHSGLTDAIARMDTVRPSWAAIQSWAAAFPQMGAPSFRKGFNVLPSKFGSRDFMVGEHTYYWAELADRYSINVSPSTNAGPISPPWADSSGRVYTYPFTGSALDEKLRALSTILLCQKARGFAVTFAMQNNGVDIPQFADHAAFLSWVSNQYIPFVVEMAEAAELIHAEYFDPFPFEAEMFMNIWHQPHLNTGTNELIASTNAWLLAIRNAIRPPGGASLYSGKLVARSATNYETGGYNDGAGGTTADGSFWTQVDYTGFDEVHVTITGSCSSTYIGSQLAGYQAVAGNIPWFISELWLYERSFAACGGTAVVPLSTYLTDLFTQLDGLSAPLPQGIAIDINPEDDGNELPAAALSVITDYFMNHP